MVPGEKPLETQQRTKKVNQRKDPQMASSKISNLEQKLSAPTTGQNSFTRPLGYMIITLE